MTSFFQPSAREIFFFRSCPEDEIDWYNRMMAMTRESRIEKCLRFLKVKNFHPPSNMRLRECEKSEDEKADLLMSGQRPQYWFIFFLRNATLRSSWSMPSTPSSILIQPSKPFCFSSVKIAS